MSEQCGDAPGDAVGNPVIRGMNVACQVPAFFGSLPFKGEEIDDKMQSNSR